MEEEYIESAALEKAEECSGEEIGNILRTIHKSCSNIENLQKRKEGKYEKKIQKLEVSKILEHLPNDVKVLHYSKKLYASRIAKNDKIIEIWRKEDLEKYSKILEKVYASKTQNFNLPRKWE